MAARKVWFAELAKVGPRRPIDSRGHNSGETRELRWATTTPTLSTGFQNDSKANPVSRGLKRDKQQEQQQQQQQKEAQNRLLSQVIEVEAEDWLAPRKTPQRVKETADDR